MTTSDHLEFDVASGLSLGARERQEDALAVAFPDGAEPGFAVLSDGMGGHAAGDLASRAIVAEVFSALTMRANAATKDAPDLLRKAVRGANEGVRAYVDARPDRNGMGGTVIATMVAQNRLHWISVGDSVLYLFRGETLERLNADHSMAPQIDMMAAKGALTEAEAANHPQRNCLISAITGDAIAEVDCPDTPLDLAPTAIVVLDSAGLQTLPDPIIEALLLRARNDDSRDILRDLMDAVGMLNDPEQDNTSIVVIRAAAARKRARPGPIRQASNALMKAFRRTVSAPTAVVGRADP